MVNSWIKAAAVAAAVVSAPIVAQETLGSGGGRAWRGGGMGMLQAADGNGDGVVTRDEWMAAADARFARMDRDGNGALDRSDRGQAAGTPDTSARKAPMRSISREQFRAGAMRRFDRVDTNHDGKIDRTEMAAAETLMRARRAGRGGEGEMAPPPSTPSSE